MGTTTSTPAITVPNLVLSQMLSPDVYKAAEQESSYRSIPELNIALTNVARWAFDTYLQDPLNTIPLTDPDRNDEICSHLYVLLSPSAKGPKVPEEILKKEIWAKVRILGKMKYKTLEDQIKMALQGFADKKKTETIGIVELKLYNVIALKAVSAFRSLPRAMRFSFFPPMFDTRVIYKYKEISTRSCVPSKIVEESEFYIGPDGVGVCGVFTNDAAWKIVEQYFQANGMISGVYSQEHIGWLLEEGRVWPLFNHQKKQVEDKINAFLQDRRAFFSPQGVADCLATICCTNDRISQESRLREIESNAAIGLRGDCSSKLRTIRNVISVCVQECQPVDEDSLERILEAQGVCSVESVQLVFEKPPKVEPAPVRKKSFSFKLSKNKEASNGNGDVGQLY